MEKKLVSEFMSVMGRNEEGGKAHEGSEFRASNGISNEGHGCECHCVHEEGGCREKGGEVKCRMT